MKKYLLTISALFLPFLTGCGFKAEPKESIVAQVASAHVEGDDVYFEYNSKYQVAKGQRENFENIQDELMIMILMSDGSYVIQQNDKKVTFKNGYDPADAKQKEDKEKQKQEQERELENQRQQQLEDDRIAYLRNKELHEQNLEQQKMDLKAERQASELQNSTDFLQTQINKIQAEIDLMK